MNRTPHNCRCVRLHEKELGAPLVETHEGKDYCEGYCNGDGGESTEFCKECGAHFDRWYAKEEM